ncbi:hypothetical protein ACTVCO_06355 [Sanguibacter sp. A247]|uniref:hypothetical protein n=1 Tax=unclassified Sanguibacter TaxID=2645534 RepID=UPI003FD8D634
MTHAPRPRSARLAAVVASAALTLAACGPSAPEEPAAAYVASDGSYHVPVIARDMRFHPASVTVPDGRRLVIELTNVDGMPHDLVTETGAGTRLLSRDETATLDVGVVDGTLDAWCAVTGHREAGMVLTISG